MTPAAADSSLTMPFERASYSDLARRLAEHAEALCAEVLPGGRVIGGEYRAAGVDGGAGKGTSGGSLAVALKGPRRGLWSDFAYPDLSGDLLDLVAASRGLALAEAARWASAWLGMDHSAFTAPRPPSSPSFAEPSRRARDDGRRRVELARAIWRRTVPIAGTTAEAYLRRRGITCALPPSLRFAPALRHAPTDTAWPALVAGVQTADRSFAGVWRIYLDRGAEPGKAPVSPAKMGMGRVGAAAVRLAPAAAVLAVAEGIETALSAATLLPDLAVWSALSAGGLTRLELPAEVRKVWLFPDADAAGLNAAEALAARQRAAGLAVRIVPPPSGNDFNDYLTSTAP